LSIICVVCKDVNEDLILPSNVVEQLFALQYQSMSCDDVQRDRDVDYVVSNVIDMDGCQVVMSSDAVIDIEVNDCENRVGSCDPTTDSSLSQFIEADRIKLAHEQQEDQTLKYCFSLLKRAKGGYFMKNGLLYHVESVLGHTTEMLGCPK
jgi:hypothetical protein